jgi:hypothetical protein
VNENTVKKAAVKKNTTSSNSSYKPLQKKSQPSVAGKTKTKPSANTKSFLA